ncbi:MAG: hypothetical protein H0T60_09050 [Acidobacteria bacterium]|nr:hypothetical protein [Acidobacteriota bacterium]
MATTNKGTAPADGAETVAAVGSAVVTEATLSKATKPEDLVDLPQTPATARALAAMETDVKVPTDLSRVSEAKAKELSEAGLVDDSDLPGKMYKRKADGFVTRIPDYTFNAYGQDLKDEWDEIKLASDAPAAPSE